MKAPPPGGGGGGQSGGGHCGQPGGGHTGGSSTGGTGGTGGSSTGGSSGCGAGGSDTGGAGGDMGSGDSTTVVLRDGGAVMTGCGTGGGGGGATVGGGGGAGALLAGNVLLTSVGVIETFFWFKNTNVSPSAARSAATNAVAGQTELRPLRDRAVIRRPSIERQTSARPRSGCGRAASPARG